MGAPPASAHRVGPCTRVSREPPGPLSGSPPASAPQSSRMQSVACVPGLVVRRSAGMHVHTGFQSYFSPLQHLTSLCFYNSLSLLEN